MGVHANIQKQYLKGLNEAYSWINTACMNNHLKGPFCACLYKNKPLTLTFIIHEHFLNVMQVLYETYCVSPEIKSNFEVLIFITVLHMPGSKV